MSWMVAAILARECSICWFPAEMTKTLYMSQDEEKSVDADSRTEFYDIIRTHNTFKYQQTYLCFLAHLVAVRNVKKINYLHAKQTSRVYFDCQWTPFLACAVWEQIL